jgi:hypothetical protein
LWESQWRKIKHFERNKYFLNHIFPPTDHFICGEFLLAILGKQISNDYSVQIPWFSDIKFDRK